MLWVISDDWLQSYEVGKVIDGLLANEFVYERMLQKILWWAATFPRPLCCKSEASTH